MKQVLKLTDMEPELLEYALQHAMIALEVSNTDKVDSSHTGHGYLPQSEAQGKGWLTELALHRR